MSVNYTLNYNSNEVNMNIKSLNTTGVTSALTVLTLLLGTASWMVARSQQSAPHIDSPMPTLEAEFKQAMPTAEVPILFTSRMDDKKAHAWLASEPTQSVEVPITGTSTMKWLSDYSGVLAVVGSKPMEFYPYDKQAHEFWRSYSCGRTFRF